MADSTLAAIRKKVRRLTRSPSEQQLSTTDIDEYINTFLLYDLPQELRLSTLRTTLTFYTQPNIDTYETNSTSGDPLENFKDKYTAVHNPVYIAGYRAYLSQSEQEFYRMYPFTNTEETVGTGDGATFAYTGTLSSTPVLRGTILFSMVDTLGDSKKLTDDGIGNLDGDGTGTIDYETGAFDIAWTDAVGSGEDIIATTYAYTAGRPDTILYFQNKFIIRPVPDKTYPIQIEVDVRPTELSDPADMPELEQWWQYIAYGAAKKVFEDRTDFDSVNEIMPEFERQESLILRRTLINLSKERTSTIYTSGIDNSGPRNY